MKFEQGQKTPDFQSKPQNLDKKQKNPRSTLVKKP